MYLYVVDMSMYMHTYVGGEVEKNNFSFKIKIVSEATSYVHSSCRSCWGAEFIRLRSEKA